MIPDELQHEYDVPADIPMSVLAHFEYVGERPLPDDAYSYETLGEFIAHYGVKGMRWGHRKMYNKYRVAGHSPDKGIQIKRRGVAGHIPIIGRKKKVTKRKLQKLSDQMGMNIKAKDISKHDQWIMGQKIAEEMTKRHYQDKQLHRQSKKAGKKADKAERKGEKAKKKKEKLKGVNTPEAKAKIQKAQKVIDAALAARRESDSVEARIRKSEERIA